MYVKCLHRDGVPSYLLKQSIELINNELGNLLKDVNFEVYMDDQFNLRLVHTETGNETPAVQASGMERTVTSLAFKVALRMINKRSKSNIIILDEVAGKLDGEKSDMFNELLQRIKERVEKILIVEHSFQVAYDHLIDVRMNPADKCSHFVLS